MASLTCSNGETLPLQTVTAHIDIVDVLARVKLSQLFVNEGSGVDLEATYQFPVPPGAAVCAFDAILDNGTTIIGIVKEKDEAKKDYDTAIASGKQAALAVQDRTDIFTISVGNIPPKAKVTVNLTYVIELNDDGDADQVRFVLPTTIAPKYEIHTSNVNPTAHATAGVDYKLNIVTSIQMSEPIRAIASPTHPVEVHLGVLEPGSENELEPRHAHMTLAAASFLDRDLVITIKAGGLDAPRCTSETYQATEHASAPNVFTQTTTSEIPPPSTALALTLVPRFNIPPIPSQEYILVADRSGSMEGFKNDTMKSALQLLLRSLPPNGSFIQIVSFGSGHTMLFPGRSVPYDEHSLNTASAHVDSMEADMGGTEIQSALVNGAFVPRRKDIPTSVFILTDGEVWDLQNVLSSVRDATKVGKDEGALRVFALGIGNAVDAALVSGIAKEGNGIAQFVAEGERMESKLIKLLRSAKSPAVRDVTVDWITPSKDLVTSTVDDFEVVHVPEAAPKPATTIFDPEHKDEPIQPNNVDASSDPVALPVFEAVQQSPITVPCIYSGSRTVIYTILSNGIAPKEVTLRAKTDAGDKLELIVSVLPCLSTSLSKLSAETEQVPLIHTLSARKLLSDLEEGKTSDQTAVVRAKMVRLGIMYNLASKYTSFVAVESEASSDPKDSKEKRPKKHVLIPTRPDRGGGKSLDLLEGSSASLGYAARYAAPASYAYSMSTPITRARKSRAAPSIGSFIPKFFTKSALAPSPPPPPTMQAMAAPPAPSGMMKMFKKTKVTAQLPSPSSSAISATGLNFESMAPGQPSPPYQADMSEAKPSVPVTKDDKRARLVRLQAFNGSFPSVADVCAILNITPPSAPSGVPDNVWATSIALAWLQKECSDEKDEWEVIASKAEAFVTGVLHGDALLAIQKAANALF